MKIKVVKTVQLPKDVAKKLHALYETQRKVKSDLSMMLYTLKEEHRGKQPPPGSSAFEEWNRTEMSVSEDHDALVFYREEK